MTHRIWHLENAFYHARRRHWRLARAHLRAIWRCCCADYGEDVVAITALPDPGADCESGAIPAAPVILGWTPPAG